MNASGMTYMDMTTVANHLVCLRKCRDSGLIDMPLILTINGTRAVQGVSPLILVPRNLKIFENKSGKWGDLVNHKILACARALDKV